MGVLALGIAGGMGIIGSACLLTLITGMVMPRSTVQLLLGQMRSEIQEISRERTYYRAAAQDCASAVTALHAQLSMIMEADDDTDEHPRTSP